MLSYGHYSAQMFTYTHTDNKCTQNHSIDLIQTES